MALTTVQTGFQQDEGGRWTLLDETSFGSNASTFDYEPTFMQSGYAYRLVWVQVYNLVPDTNNTEVYMRLKHTDNAGSIDAGFATTGYYQGQWQWDWQGSNLRTNNNGSNLPQAWDNMADKGTVGRKSYYDYYILNGGMTADSSGSDDHNYHIWWQGNNWSNNGDVQHALGNAWGDYDIHGMQWYASSGDMDGGMLVKAYYDTNLGSN